MNSSHIYENRFHLIVSWWRNESFSRRKGKEPLWRENLSLCRALRVSMEWGKKVPETNLFSFECLLKAGPKQSHRMFSQKAERWWGTTSSFYVTQSQREEVTCPASESAAELGPEPTFLNSHVSAPSPIFCCLAKLRRHSFPPWIFQ